MVGTSHRSVAARRVGARLREVFENTRAFPDGTTMTVRAVGRRAGMAHTKVSRIFNEHIRPKPEDVRLLGELIGIPPGELTELVALAHFDVDDGPQWMPITPPDRATQRGALEEFLRHASGLATVTPSLVPGILQIPDYTTAILRGNGVAEYEIDERVKERSGRQEILLRPNNPAKLTALIGHEALLRTVGGQEVMAEQMLELLAWTDPSRRGNINIQVIPLDTNWHPGLEGPFWLIEFGDGQPDIVHLEIRTTSLFLHQAPEVHEYRRAVDTVRGVAMDPDESRDLIAHIATQLDQGSESVA